MKHLQASRLLSECGTGRLGPETAQALDAHITECPDCRRWLAIYQLLAGSLVESSSGKHLNTEDLCAFALESPDLSRSTRDRCERHLESCSECSEEVGLVRSAARESTEEIRLTRRPGPWFGADILSSSRLALAASLVLVIGGFLIVGRKSAPVPEEIRLVGHSVQGNSIIEASQSILVEATEIESGSSLNLQSESIVFGDGFSVESGASLVAGTAGGS